MKLTRHEAFLLHGQAQDKAKYMLDKLSMLDAEPMNQLKEDYTESLTSLTQTRATFVEIALAYALTHIHNPRSEKPKSTMKNVIAEQLSQILKKKNGIDEGVIEPHLLQAAREYS